MSIQIFVAIIFFNSYMWLIRLLGDITGKRAKGKEKKNLETEYGDPACRMPCAGWLSLIRHWYRMPCQGYANLCTWDFVLLWWVMQVLSPHAHDRKIHGDLAGPWKVKKRRKKKKKKLHTLHKDHKALRVVREILISLRL